MSAVLALLALLLWTELAVVQSSPGFLPGQRLRAPRLNQAFQAKVDYPINPNALLGVANTWTVLQTLQGGALMLTRPLGDNTTNAATTAFATAAIAAAASSDAGSVVLPNANALANATPIPISINRVEVQDVTSTSTTFLLSTAPHCPLTYYRGSTGATGMYQEVLNTQSGIYWEPDFDTSPVRACQFGTIGNGTFNYSNNVVTGFDNTTALQNAIDFALRYTLRTVCLDDGTYKTSDTLVMGWGKFNNVGDIRSISIRSCGEGRAAYASLPGVTILPTKYDRCAFNFAGGRNQRISGMQIVGGNHVFAGSANTAPFPTTPAGWLDPAMTPGSGANTPGGGPPLPLGPGGINRYAPYAAICVDAYAGTAPTAYPYPPLHYPAWTQPNTANTQYGHAASSDILIDDVFIDGFGICVSVQSSGYSGNGDFVKWFNSACRDSVYGISIGQSQSRNVSMQNVNYSNLHTFLTNTQFGTQNGQLGGNVLNVSGGQSYQFLDINVGIGSTTVQDTYSEAMVRIGHITGGTITFRNCHYSFYDTSSGTGQSPAALIEAGAGSASITLSDCYFSGSSRVGVIAHFIGGGSLTISGGVLIGGNHAGEVLGSVNNAAQIAVNYTGGWFAGALTWPMQGLANPLLWENISYMGFMFTPTDVAHASVAGWTAYPQVSVASHQPVTQAMQGFYDGGENSRYTFRHGPNNYQTDFSGSGTWATRPTLTSCDTWTGGYAGSQQRSQTGELRVGDIVYHLGNATLWVIENVTGSGPYTITLRQHNNMQLSGNGVCANNNLAPNVGGAPPVGTQIPAGAALVIHAASTFVSGQVIYCDFAQGAINATNCDVGAANNIGGMATTLRPGDKLWSGSLNDPTWQWPFGSEGQIATISTVNTSVRPASITFSVPSIHTGRFPVMPFPTIGTGLPNTMGRGAVVLPGRVGTTNAVPVGGLGACSATNLNAIKLVNNAAPPITVGATATTGTFPSIVNWVVQCNGTNWVYM